MPDADDIGFCICDLEWCFCTEIVTFDAETKRKVLAGEDYTAACPQCAAGFHILALGGPRSGPIQEVQ